MALFNALPFIGFGFLDNFIMIVAVSRPVMLVIARIKRSCIIITSSRLQGLWIISKIEDPRFIEVRLTRLFKWHPICRPMSFAAKGKNKEKK